MERGGQQGEGGTWEILHAEPVSKHGNAEGAAPVPRVLPPAPPYHCRDHCTPYCQPCIFSWGVLCPHVHGAGCRSLGN